MLPIIISAIEDPQDRELMTRFYYAHRDTIYTEVRKYIRNPQDVEDTVFETLARIIDKMDVFRQLQAVQRVVYALTTARNLSFIHLNNTYREQYCKPDTSMLQDPPLLEEDVERKHRNAQVRDIWVTLDTDERLLLEQKYLLQWEDEEIAKHWGIQPQSVRMRLTRAKRRVMKQMKSKGFDLADWED